MEIQYEFFILFLFEVIYFDTFNRRNDRTEYMKTQEALTDLMEITVYMFGYKKDYF
jgi:hypothetical protein